MNIRFFSNIRTGMLLTLVALATTLGACSKADPNVIGDPFAPKPQQQRLPLASATVGGRIVEAGTDTRIADALVTVNGEQVSENGLFVVQPQFDTASTNLTLEITAPGYLPRTYRVVLENGTIRSLRIGLVDPANPPDGSAFASTSGNATAGATDAQIIVTTPATDGTNAIASTTVDIPAGTPLFDDNGDPVSGTITLDAVSFDPNLDDTNTDVLGNAPLGDSVRAEVGGQAQEGVFVTGWFASIDLSNQDGTEITSFGGNTIDISIELPAGSLNPVTGNPLADGETVPIWYYDEDAGLWVRNTTDATITDPPLTASFSVDHLSWWLMGDFYSEASGDAAVLEVTVPAADERPLDIIATQEGVRAFDIVNEPAGSVSFLLPCVRTIARDTDLRALLQGAEVGTATVIDVCSEPSINLNVTLPAAPNGSIPVRVMEECPDGSNRRAIRSAPVFWEGPFNGNAAADDNGRYTIGALSDGAYDITVGDRRDNFFSETVTITGENTVSREITFIMPCTNVTGATDTTSGPGDI